MKHIKEIIEELSIPTPNTREQPAILISYCNERFAAIEPVLVPIDWDYEQETLPFSVGSNQLVTTDKVYVQHALTNQ